MRTTIVSTAAALALLLSGCGGGDDEAETAAAPGEVSAPTPSARAEATAEATSDAATGSTSSDKPKSKPKKAKDDALYDGPGKVGPYAPPLDPLLPEHPADGPYPASQLEPEYSGDTIVYCAAAFPFDRILKPVPATNLSPEVKLVLSDLATVEDFIVAVADKDYVQIMELPTAENDFDVEYWDINFEYKKGSTDTGRWRYYHDIMPEDCSVERVLPNLRRYDVSLTAAPRPGDRSLQVEIYDEACGGVAPNSQMKVPILDMKPDGIRLALGREAMPEGCQVSGKYKLWPYTIQLPEPVGTRPIIDVGAYPEHKVTFDERSAVAGSATTSAGVMPRQNNSVRLGRRPRRR